MSSAGACVPRPVAYTLPLMLIGRPSPGRAPPTEVLRSTGPRPLRATAHRTSPRLEVPDGTRSGTISSSVAADLTRLPAAERYVRALVSSWPPGARPAGGVI